MAVLVPDDLGGAAVTRGFARNHHLVRGVAAERIGAADLLDLGERLHVQRQLRQLRAVEQIRQELGPLLRIDVIVDVRQRADEAARVHCVNRHVGAVGGAREVPQFARQVGVGEAGSCVRRALARSRRRAALLLLAGLSPATGSHEERRRRRRHIASVGSFGPL
jgi:hypothetical protein